MSKENKAADNANTPTVEPVGNGMLYGILVIGSLLIKRGGRFVSVNCSTMEHIMSQPGTWTNATPKLCNDFCVCFGEPKWFEDGTAEIELCNGKVLKFNKLIDLRGHLDDINIATASREEIIDWLYEHNIVSSMEERGESL